MDIAEMKLRLKELDLMTAAGMEEFKKINKAFRDKCLEVKSECDEAEKRNAG